MVTFGKQSNNAVSRIFEAELNANVDRMLKREVGELWESLDPHHTVLLGVVHTYLGKDGHFVVILADGMKQASSIDNRKARMVEL